MCVETPYTMLLFHNFAKYRPIFKLLSLANSAWNWQQIIYISYHILNMLLYYRAKLKYANFIIFTARPHCLQCRALWYLQQFRLSVCLSVRPSVTRWYPIQTNEHRITRSSLWGSKNTLVFWYQQWLGGDVPFHLKFALKMTYSLWNAPTSTNIC